MTRYITACSAYYLLYLFQGGILQAIPSNYTLETAKLLILVGSKTVSCCTRAARRASRNTRPQRPLIPWIPAEFEPRTTQSARVGLHDVSLPPRHRLFFAPPVGIGCRGRCRRCGPSSPPPSPRQQQQQPPRRRFGPVESDGGRRQQQRRQA